VKPGDPILSEGFILSLPYRPPRFSPAGQPQEKPAISEKPAQGATQQSIQEAGNVSPVDASQERHGDTADNSEVGT
jgi:hypothetical protein